MEMQQCKAFDSILLFHKIIAHNFLQPPGGGEESFSLTYTQWLK